MKIKKFNIRPEWFGAYGLDKEKNFMQYAKNTREFSHGMN